MKVPFLDLSRQHATLGPKLAWAVADVLAGGQFILGPQVRALEEEMAGYCDAGHPVGGASGTDALRLAWRPRASAPAPGEHARFHLRSHCGDGLPARRRARVRRRRRATLTLDPTEAARRITGRTRAIIPVHLYGQPADMAPVLALAERHGLVVVEDAAQAVGAEYRGPRAGSLGHLACFSFFPTKNLGDWRDGGLVTTADPALAERLRMLRQHGSRAKYVQETLGWSSRLDELQAAILRVKLCHLDAWTEQRHRRAACYRELLDGLPLGLPAERPGTRAVYHIFTVWRLRRDELRRFLDERGIGTMVHYPLPLHPQPAYRSQGAGPLPESERAAREVLSLALYAELGVDELEAVTVAVRDFFA